MNIKDLRKLDFESAISILHDENNDITDIETIKDFIIEKIRTDNFMLAYHLLESTYNSDTPHLDTYYYKYDYSMGTCNKPQELNTIEDLEQFCEED